ncbi:hypothetical protein U1Q18_052415 [Sarracenia purpurea var. burkii]
MFMLILGLVYLLHHGCTGVYVGFYISHGSGCYISHLGQHDPYQGHEQVTVGNGSTLPILNTDQTIFPTTNAYLRLHNVLHIPKMNSNWILAHQLNKENDCTTTFYSNPFTVQDRDYQNYPQGSSHKWIVSGASSP